MVLHGVKDVILIGTPWLGLVILGGSMCPELNCKGDFDMDTWAGLMTRPLSYVTRSMDRIGGFHNGY